MSQFYADDFITKSAYIYRAIAMKSASFYLVISSSDKLHASVFFLQIVFSCSAKIVLIVLITKGTIYRGRYIDRLSVIKIICSLCQF